MWWVALLVSYFKIRIFFLDVPGIPDNIRITSKGNFRLNLTWRLNFTGNAPIRGYRIKTIKNGTNEHKEVVIQGNSSRVILPLVANRRYSVQISARNLIGFGNYSLLKTLIMDNVTGENKRELKKILKYHVIQSMTSNQFLTIPWRQLLERL